MVHKGFHRQWLKFKDILLHHILHVEDTPRRIAWGAAIGIFVAWTPTFGLQTILGIALATLLGGNKAAIVPMVWITNPVTNPAIYGFNYFIGHFLLTGSFTIDPIIKHQMAGLMKETMRLDIWDANFWSRLGEVTLKIGAELWLGSCIVGALVAVATYFLTQRAVVRYRRHRQKRCETLDSLRS